MDDLAAEVLRWLLPAVVVFGVTTVLIVAAAWAVRAARRSPRARSRAEQSRTQAGSDLVRLDDAVEELELEVGLSGALYGGGAPASLGRARMTATHMREDAFRAFQALDDDADHLLPRELRRRAEKISGRVDEALAVIAHARAEHDRWVHENVSATSQVEAARARLADVRTTMGDPAALVTELKDRFDESEWSDAAAAATAAVADANEAEELLSRAAEEASDPSRSALADLEMAERRIRSARTQAERLEHAHRLSMQAFHALDGEFAAARDAIRLASTTREALRADAAQRLGDAVHRAQASLDAAAVDAQAHPTAAVEQIARLRAKLDVALGDAHTLQQRLRGARTALTGTIAAAGRAVARAEASVSGAGADARVRLTKAQEELASARQLPDPVEALDAARRAMRHAEDAEALAGYDRMSSGR